jgi:beta-lactamase class A
VTQIEATSRTTFEKPLNGNSGATDGAERAVAISPRVQAAFQAHVAQLETQLSGVMGASIRHLESGERVSVNGDERFPMASTFKVAIAGAALCRVDRGEIDLSQLVEVRQRDFDETGPVAQSVRHPGVSLSVANLIELMLTQSNNNATDRVLERIGGPQAVTVWLRSIGLREMRVDSTVNDILNKFYGFPPGTPAHKTFLERYPTPEEQAVVAGTTNSVFDDSPEDTSTPDDMAELLSQLLAGPRLTPSSRDFLTGVMERCETGLGRLRGLLPSGVVVADKTGSVGGTINDVGMITLPPGRGRVIIAVFTKKSTIVPYAARERFIAEIARSAYDYFSIR